MPELPEVETVKRSLAPLLEKKRIEEVILHKEIVVAHPEPCLFIQKARGRQIEGISRRGKYLQIALEGGHTLVVHLRMTGALVFSPLQEPLPKHTHAVFQLDDGNLLRYTDIRRFGRLWLVAAGERDDFTGRSKLGLEPFDAGFSAQYLADCLKKRRITIKQALLDQRVIAGLGNIYADEILFAAGIAPWRPVSELAEEEWQKLAQIIPAVLEESIRHRGTSFRDYQDGLGQKGDNLSRLQVYQRKGQPCPCCGQALARTVVAQRGTFYCAACQK